MARHRVTVSLPDVELRRKDAFFDIYENGRKLGTITISKGSIEWYPRKAKHPYRITWTKFDQMIRAHFEG